MLGMGVPLASGGWARLPWAPDSPAHRPKVVQSSFWAGDSRAECCAHISFPEAPLGSPLLWGVVLVEIGPLEPLDLSLPPLL